MPCASSFSVISVPLFVTSTAPPSPLAPPPPPMLNLPRRPVSAEPPAPVPLVKFCASPPPPPMLCAKIAVEASPVVPIEPSLATSTSPPSPLAPPVPPTISDQLVTSKTTLSLRSSSSVTWSSVSSPVPLIPLPPLPPPPPTLCATMPRAFTPWVTMLPVLPTSTSPPSFAVPPSPPIAATKFHSRCLSSLAGCCFEPPLTVKSSDTACASPPSPPPPPMLCA